MGYVSYSAADDSAYFKAKKLGVKAYHTALQRGENPYLEVLDEVEPEHLSLARQNMGLITIPMERVAGTVTRGRTSAFASNFMPLLEEGSEFAMKWNRLHHSVVDSGVREPIRVLEYLNRYYVIEGNKRVSVSKYLGAVMIEANVTRVMPKRSDDEKTRIYFEYLDFNRDTKINYLYFTEEGSFAQLYELVGKKPGEPWTAEEAADFRVAYYRFSDAYELAGGDLTKVPTGDAFLLYLKIYGYGDLAFGSSDIRANLNSLRDEFRAMGQDESISLLLSTQGQKPGLFQQFIHQPPQKLNVAFVNNKSPQVSGWAYWHELGKNRIESVFGSKVDTRMVSEVTPEDCQRVIEEQIDQGANVVFTTSPLLLDGAMRAAVRYPDVKILNCSLLPLFHTVRSYYLRMYEAKFIIGAIAGAVCENDRIGYIADYPVYGAPTSINAFALGARLTNPRAKVYLEWSSRKDRDPAEQFERNNVRVISNRDISAPSHRSMEFGLYCRENDMTRNLAMPVWNWGHLYEDLLRRVQSGVWRTDGEQNSSQAMNYWWGMDANAIDVFYSSKLDSGTRRLTDLLRHQVRDGELRPFAEKIVDQSGALRCAAGEALTPAQLLSMDWLVDNVVGDIPDNDQIKPEALPFVTLQGIHSVKAPESSVIQWTDPFSEEE